MEKILILRSEAETIRLAEKISRQVTIGDVIALSGELGAGKTFFAQALCRFLGVTEYVSSPSFIILNEYEGRFPIAHYDLYRLGSVEEVLEVGIPEIFEQRLTIIEWYETAQELLPPETVYLDFLLVDDQRKVRVAGKNIYDL
jgi:tRNA threonylcarbamoyladenosine biosynthesis protein TsaE